jgi:hypothetical protein
MRQATKMIDLFRINPDATLAASCLLAITILLTIDVISYLGQYQDRFLNYPLLGIMLGLLFVGFGRRITKLAFDPSKGLTLEQELRRFDDLTRMIDRVRDHASVENVTALLARVNAEEDVWSRLMIFRLILRHLLRSACLSLQRRDPGDAPSIETMLNGLREEGHLSDELYERAKNLGWWTYYAEWGTGQRLDDSEMPGFLAGAPLTLLELTRSCLSARTE